MIGLMPKIAAMVQRSNLPGKSSCFQFLMTLVGVKNIITHPAGPLTSNTEINH